MNKTDRDLGHLSFYLSQANVYRLLLIIGSILLVVLGNLHNYFEPALTSMEEVRYTLAIAMLIAAVLSVWVGFFQRHLITISYISYSLLCLWTVFVAARNDFASSYWPGILVLISISGAVFSHFRPFIYFSVAIA